MLRSTWVTRACRGIAVIAVATLPAFAFGQISTTGSSTTGTGGSSFGRGGTSTTGTTATGGSTFGSTTGSSLGAGGSSVSGGSSLSGLQSLLQQAGLTGSSTGSGSTGSLFGGTTGAPGTIGTTGTLGGGTRGGTTGGTRGGTTGGGAGSGGGVNNSGRTPIITNQFIDTRGVSLAQRRPGRQLTQATVVNQTGSTFTQAAPAPLFTTASGNETNFFMFTFQQLIKTFLDSISQGLSNGLFGGNSSNSFNSLGSSGLFGNTTQTPNRQTTITPIQNAATTGQGTTTVVP